MSELWTNNITIKYVLEDKGIIVGHVTECQWSDNKSSIRVLKVL